MLPRAPAFAIALPLLLIPAAAFAQPLGAPQTSGPDARPDLSDSPPQPLPDNNPDIIVAALPLPPAAAAYGPVTIDGETLAATASARIEEALARIPGFQQFRRSDSRSANPSAQGITLRAIGGNASSRTLLLLDGVPQADAFFGFIPFTALPADSIASARITRGSGIGPFGSGAVAGTIEFFSRPPSERERLAASATIGSDEARELTAAAAFPLGAGHIAIDARHDRGDGFFTTPLAQRVAATVPARYRASQLALTAAVPLSQTVTLHPRIAAFRDDRTLRFAGADNSAEGIDASLRLLSAPARGWQVEALGWLQARDFSTVVVSATSFRPTLDQRATPTTGWGGKLELRAPGSATRLLRFGIDARGASGRADEDVLAISGARTLTRRAGGNTLTLGAFTEGDVILGNLSLTAGARLDHWRLSEGIAQEIRPDGTLQRNDRFAARSDTIPSFRAAAAYALGPVTLRASAYTGYRLPTLNELYRGFTVFPVTTRANAALDPERLRGVEAALELRPATGATLGLTAFDNRLSDAIANVTIATNLRQRQNVAAIRARGLEASLNVATGPWRLDAGWAYSDATVRAPATALDRLRPAQTPRHAGSATLAWARGDWLVKAGVRHIGTQYEDDRNIDILPAATTIDALIRAPIGAGFTLVLRGENLTDEVVVTRDVAGSIDLGTPRTLWIGFRWAG